MVRRLAVLKVAGRSTRRWLLVAAGTPGLLALRSGLAPLVLLVALRSQHGMSTSILGDRAPHADLMRAI